MVRAVPWAVVGFVVGAVVGIQWGQKAKSRIGEAVSTEFDNGVVRVEVDTYQAARAGLSDGLNNFIDRL